MFGDRSIQLVRVAGIRVGAGVTWFLFVGIAYFITAVLAPLVVLLANGANWQLPAAGMTWSLIAGIAGALGAFFVLLAFGAKGSPAVVMAIVFGGAPIVNAVVAMAMHRVAMILLLPVMVALLKM